MGVGVGEMVGVGVIVGVCVTVAVPVGDGGEVLVSVGTGAASTFPPQAVKKIDTTNVNRINCFIDFKGSNRHPWRREAALSG